MRRGWALSAALIVGVLAAVPTPLLVGQELSWIREHYTKHEYVVPMRDGVRLFTAVYTPKDRSKTYPILMRRTPYSVAPYGADRYPDALAPSPELTKDGYIVVFQDVRGRWMSEGEFVHLRPHKAQKAGPRDVDESTDTYDTIEWLLRNVSGHNGRVGQWGVSYPGFYTAAGMIDAHPALKASSPQAPVSDWFGTDDFRHNGAFMLAHAFGFFAQADWPRAAPTAESPLPFARPPVADGYEFYLRAGTLRTLTATFMKDRSVFWNDLLAHDTRDAFWQARNIRQHLKNIRPAVMTVGGWYDAENLFGALEVYKHVESHSPRGSYNTLVMGPWVHGGWSRSDGRSLADVHFAANTGAFYRERIERPFFNFFLKDEGGLDLPEAYVFETGANQWRRMEAWPPPQAQARPLYFGPGGTLGTALAANAGDNAFDEYVSDPARPVPYIPGTSFGMAQRYMVDDQRFASRRTDVLVYRTDILEDDLTVAGPVEVSLHVSTTGTDADWVVKLIDVYPDQYPDENGSTENALGAYQQMVRGDVIRGKFRKSLETPEPFTPGEPTLVKFRLEDLFHTFRRGHRVMVHVQSSWFPLIDRNPQKFMRIHEADAADFQKATHRVYRSASRPSGITLGVVSRQ